MAEAIQTEIEAELDYLADRVEIMEVVDVEDADTLRKSMGTATHAVRITFPDSGPISGEPGMGQVMMWRFDLVVTVLYRSLGNAFTRLSNGGTPDAAAMAKAVIAVLETKTFNILNQGGLACGPAKFVSRGNALQAMQFTVTARSREMRS